MPELPEVETIRRTLLPLVAGKTIEEVRVFWPNIIRHPQDPAAFAARLAGQTVRGIDRRGKFLKFLLDRDMLISHLRMEGATRSPSPMSRLNRIRTLCFVLQTAVSFVIAMYANSEPCTCTRKRKQTAGRRSLN